MLNNNEAARVLETILSTPGMGETVKIDLKITRKNVLLLSQVVERGLSSKGDGDGAMVLSKDAVGELAALSADCLQKAGLTELNEKLKALYAPK